MKIRLITILIIAIVCIAAWLFWSRPRRVDMAGYVPADSLVFFEVDDLPDVAQGIVGTDAWRLLSGPAGASINLSISHWLVPIARWTGLGPTEKVLLARSQFAVSLIRLETSDDDNSLNIKPVGTLVIETHTAQFRMRPIFDKKIETLAHHLYGNPQLETKVIGGVDFGEWKSPEATRKIIYAYSGTAVYIGNDEDALRACLGVRQGAQAGLAGNKSLSEVRDQLDVKDPSVFGFISPAGLKALITVTVPTLLDSGPNTNVASFVAASAAKLVQGIAWSPRFVDGQVEDHYVCLLATGVAAQLRDGIGSDRPLALSAANVLTRETYSLTEYNFRDATAAWHDLNTAIASHVDFASALVAPRLLTSSLRSYGIDDPDAFLAAVGPQISTARTEPGAKALLVVEVLDAQALRKLMLARLGSKSTSEVIGGAEMQVSVERPDEAISFVENNLLIGSPETIRNCLQAKAESRTLATNETVRRAITMINPAAQTTAVTLTSDADAARSFVLLFSSNRSALSTDVAKLNDAAKRLPYAVKVTRLSEYGFEQTARSSFGLIGSLFVRFGSGDKK